MSDKFDDQLFKRLEDLRGQVDEAQLDALEKRLDQADRSLVYHTQQAAEAHSPDLQIANLEIIEKRREEITAIAAEVDKLEVRPRGRIGSEEHQDQEGERCSAHLSSITTERIEQAMGSEFVLDAVTGWGSALTEAMLV